MKRLVMRVADAPLTNAHLAAALDQIPGAGFERDPSDLYRDVEFTATSEKAAGNQAFQLATRGMVFPVTRKPVSKHSPKEQFRLIAPSIIIGPATEETIAKAGDLVGEPFVVTRSKDDRLAALVTDHVDSTTDMRLRGFLENHRGCPAVIVVE